MKVLLINSSFRAKSNSEALGEAFLKGAKESGNEVESISLKGKKIGFCHGCLACQKTGKCVQSDDVEAIIKKIHDADVVGFASPIYYYEMSGQLKTLLDRSNPLFTSDYHFRKIYGFFSAADDEPSTPERAIAGIEGWVDCFPNSKLAGTFFAGGLTNATAAKGKPVLEEAYKAGKSLK